MLSSLGKKFHPCSSYILAGPAPKLSAYVEDIYNILGLLERRVADLIFGISFIALFGLCDLKDYDTQFDAKKYRIGMCDEMEFLNQALRESLPKIYQDIPSKSNLADLNCLDYFHPSDKLL